jgi:folate-binding protein YgfZ
MLFTLLPADLVTLRSGCAAVPVKATVIRVEGPGAVDCVQGIFTNDVARPGPGAVVYGALLTPKGMIVVDGWVFRDGAECMLIADRPSRDQAVELLRHRIPPRLARWTDLSDDWQAHWLVGPAVERLAGSTLAWPAAAGQSLRDGDVLIGRLPQVAAPIGGLIVGPNQSVETIARRLAESGVSSRSEEMLHAARVLAGWPTIGREIGDKTLPQEVRYDEIDGVSYTKGCYIGQETVARVHFRGHPNRYLRGVTWEGEAPSSWTVRAHSREVGQVSSALQVEGLGLGLALLRREVEPGMTVTLDATEGRVVRLPFAWPEKLARAPNG